MLGFQNKTHFEKGNGNFTCRKIGEVLEINDLQENESK